MKYLLNKEVFFAVLFGFIVGSVVSGVSVYQNFESKYFVIHKTNIGGFVFWNGKIFNLSEMKDIKD
jgi:hypothetical protein